MKVIKRIKGIINDFNQALDAYAEDFVTKGVEEEQNRLAKKAARKAKKSHQPE